MAMNPYWSRNEVLVRQVAAAMDVMGGMQVFPACSHPADLAHARKQVPAEAGPGVIEEQHSPAI